MKTSKGFTLIELLVVIAIIGILSSVVLASLSTARAKSRDARRISDLGQIQLALELYFDSASTYPTTTPAAVVGSNLNVLTPTYIPKIPTDPTPTTKSYYYGGSATTYVLGTILERDDNPALKTDADATAFSFTGGFASCTGSAVTPELCYDITP
jgi:prepilin-type N-terminal cleavage/methylation domain-containing protein